MNSHALVPLMRPRSIAAAYGELIEAIDLNPVAVLPSGRGVRVLDALVIPRRVSHFWRNQSMQQAKPEDGSIEAARRQALRAAESAAETAAGVVTVDAANGVEVIESDPARLVIVVPRSLRMFMIASGGLVVACYFLFQIWEPLSLQSGSVVENTIPFFRARPYFLLHLFVGMMAAAWGLRGVRSMVFGERYIFDRAMRKVSRGSRVLAKFDAIEAVELKNVTAQDSLGPEYCLRLSLKDGGKLDVFTVNRLGGVQDATEKIAKAVGVPISPGR